MNHLAGTFAQRHLDAAGRILQGQQLVPRSPAARTNQGEVALCTAAAIAVAATRERGGDCGRLAEQLAGPNGMEALYNVFHGLGWSRELCRRVQLINDGFEESCRKERMLRLLAGKSALA